MTLHPDWKRILRKAWSIKLILLAGVLSGLEFALPYFSDVVPRGLFAVLSFFVVGGAFVARLVAQKEM